jgi:hypothetical protein
VKILCFSRKGKSRAACLANLLHHRGHETIAVGARVLGRETRKMLFEWADRIILLHEKCETAIPDTYWDKLSIWEVGRDTYFKGWDEKLVGLYEKYIKRDRL